MGTIIALDINQLAAIVAALVKQGLVFEAMYDEDGDCFRIKLTGGY